MIRSHNWFGVTWLCLLLFSRLPAYGQTTFLADFDTGLDASYAAGSPKVLLGIKFPAGAARLVEGKFGQGLFLDKKVYQFQFGYETTKNFRHEQGTVEFWFRPEWDSDFIDPDAPAWIGKASSLTLFSTLESPTGFRLSKNQYNFLSFFYTNNYKSYATVGVSGKFWKKGEWVHCAASWDQNEGRLFLNGKLIACSDEWEASTPYEYRMFLSGWGTFDDFRVSGDKIYVSSFQPPVAPLTVRKKASPPPPALTAEEKKALAQNKVLLHVDCSRSLTAVTAAGSPEPISNRPLELSEKALRLTRTGILPETTLCYAGGKNVNQFLGTAEIAFRASEKAVLPVTLLDFSEIEQQTYASGYGRTGMRLVLTKDGRVEWQNLFAGRVIDAVTSKPLALKRDAWNRVSVSWRASTVSIYSDGVLCAQKVGASLPVKLAPYVFVGSDSLGENTLDGWVREVTIRLQ